MPLDLDEILSHTTDEDCPVCRAQDIAASFLVPAAASWEMGHGLPRFALAIHGAAGLLAVMLEDGISREEIEHALGLALDDLEQQIAEHNLLGGPPQGSA